MTSKLFVNSLEPMQGNTISVAGSDTVLHAPGHVIQVVEQNIIPPSNVTITTSADTYTGYSISITPKFASSKILIDFNVNVQSTGTGIVRLKIYKDGSNTLGYSTWGSWGGYSNSKTENISVKHSEVNSGTSSRTYQLYVSNHNSSTTYAPHENTNLSMTLMEIAQ